MKTLSKSISLLTLVMLVLTTARGGIMNFPVGTAIPDGNPTGLSDTQTVGSPITSIDAGSLRVSLNINGGFNGDLYAHVTHATGFSVLLNRVGRTTLDAFGYDDAGFQVTFDDSAPNGNVHLYRDTVAPGSPLVGTFAPDGRDINPNDVLDTVLPTAFLSSFDGVDPNGEWTLFVADLTGGDVATLESWGIEFTGVPEPRATAVAMGCLLLVAVVVRRASRGVASGAKRSR